MKLIGYCNNFILFVSAKLDRYIWAVKAFRSEGDSRSQTKRESSQQVNVFQISIILQEMRLSCCFCVFSKSRSSHLDQDRIAVFKSVNTRSASRKRIASYSVDEMNTAECFVRHFSETSQRDNAVHDSVEEILVLVVLVD